MVQAALNKCTLPYEKRAQRNLNEQVNIPGVKRTVYFWKERKNFTKLEEAIVTSFSIRTLSIHDGHLGI